MCIAWEAGHRVPFFAHWPGRITPRRTTALTSNLDLLPTLLDLANLTAPPTHHLDGLSLTPLLFNTSQHTHHTSLFHQDQNGTLTAMRLGPLKAYWQTYGANDGACGGLVGGVVDHSPPLVFNLSVDLAESVPVVVGEEVLGEMERLLKAKLSDIEGSARSVADYSNGDLAERPCCDAGHIVCRCNQ